MEEVKLKESITMAVKLLANGGHILVKYKGKMFVAEKNNVDQEKDYVHHEVTYHPHQGQFTI